MVGASIKQAVVLCGGFGTRMRELTKNLPKPMLPVNDKPVLEHTIELLKLVGITNVIFAAHYKAEVIRDYFGDGSNWGMQMSTSVETQPLGTAGPLTLIKEQLDENFLVLYGDEFIDFDLKSMLQQHEKLQPLATILARPSTHPWDAHLMQTDAEGRINEFVRMREPGRHYYNLGNGAIYVLSKNILTYIPDGQTSGFAENVFTAALQHGEHLQSWTLKNGFIMDLASPERLAAVEQYLRHKAEIERARVERKPIKIAFLDRDGVLVEDLDNIRTPNDLVMLPGAAEAVRHFNDSGIKTILVTNQPVLARGLCDQDTFDQIHEKLKTELGKEGAILDAIYYCPHHPETHHGQGVVELRRACDCRKPKPGMLLKAKEEHGFDLGSCVMIGDSSTDIEAGNAAGVRTILLKTGAGRVSDKGPSADYTYNSLLDAAKAITRGDVE